MAEKPDVAHEMTDDILRRLEKRVAREYQKAYKSAKSKLNKYLADFEEMDKEKQEQVKNGIITEREYKTWRLNKIAVGKQWGQMAGRLAKEYTNANKIAAGIINDDLNGVFALNANYAQYQAERLGYGLGTSFALYDEDTVAKLLREQPDLLPPAQVDISKDLKWNSKKITSAITQGILSGDSIPKIADRLQTVTDMNRASAIRNARTAVTSAQNAGRQERYNAFAKKSLPLRKRWIATKDNRTRHAHGMADGQTVGLNEPFIVDGYEMMYPGDKSAPGYLVYNCRCTTRTVEKEGIEADQRDNKQTYAEWIKEMQKNQYSDIIGMETSNGIEIQLVTKHFTDQMKNRDITFDDVKDALGNTLKWRDTTYDINGKPAQRFVGENATVNVNPYGGILVTCWSTSSKLKRKLNGR